MIVVLIITFLVILVTVEGVNRRKILIEAREKSTKYTAEVVGINRDIGEDYDREPRYFNFVFVRILGEDPNEIIRIENASLTFDKFETGDLVEVFYNNGKIFLWNKYERGLNKDMPELLKIF